MHDIIYNYLLDFQKGKSTDHAVLDICSKIITTIEKKTKSCCIFIDFRKAFYTVDHNILLLKSLKLHFFLLQVILPYSILKK